MLLRAPLILILLSLFSKNYSQKYNFVNFTVEDGLIQSQAMHIVQDKNRYLWIGTEGGLCRFDGKHFKNYSLQDGLNSNFINRLLCDPSGNIWIATKRGLCYFNGKQFKQVLFQNKQIGPCNFLVNKDDKIYTLNNFRLLYTIKDQIHKQTISDTSEKISCITKTQNGDILATVFGKGIYLLQGSAARLLHSFKSPYSEIFIRSVFISSNLDTLLSCSKGLLQLKNGKIDFYKTENGSEIRENVYGLEELNSAIWFGTDKGAYKIEQTKLIHFNSRNGLSDNNVYSIFKDAENNLWFATDADGIFKFKENNFSFYDKSFGLINPTIMGVAQTSEGNIFAADYSGNVYKIDPENKIEPIRIVDLEKESGKINTIYADHENNLYIGSVGKSLLKYNERKGLEIIGENDNYKLKGSNCFLKDERNRLLVGGSQGLFILNNTTIKKVNTPQATFNAIVQGPDKKILIASTNGLLLLDTNDHAENLNVKGIDNNEILCLKYQDGIIWLGTTEHGVFRYDKKTEKVIQYNISKGLPSNFIYSMIVLNNTDVWLGTGFGICNIKLNNNGELLKVKNYSRAEGLSGMECNHTSELLARDSTLWFGTTKGLAHFKPEDNKVETARPFVHLRSVKLFSSEIKDSAVCNGFSSWFNIPLNLNLKAQQNHLTFELGGIFLSNPEEILYKYKLEGIDKAFTVTDNPVINYPALPAGKYNLFVTALTKGGLISENAISYPFRIQKPFYQQLWFLGLMFIAAAVIIGLSTLFYIRKKQNEKRMREAIREEEFTKLRQRTAEDFHDEMGNKLTRISILTDILRSKFGDTQEAMNIVTQIKENTKALYNGSKDIIWSLNSSNDNFYEIVEHIKALGLEIFSETNIQFNFKHNVKADTGIKMKLDYSRNLIMIFKEVYNNILKHSAAAEVTVNIQMHDNGHAEIHIQDNGKGFVESADQKGNGLKNIRNRIQRINGELELSTAKDRGTSIRILLKNTLHK